MWMIFRGWSNVEHVVVVGVLGYIALIALVRMFGNRTLAKMNAVDVIVSITLGSLLARAMLAPANSFTEMVAGFVTLIGLQSIVSLIAARSDRFHAIITPPPRVLYDKGGFRRATMERLGVGEPEVRAAVRQAGLPDFTDVRTVICETQGEFSVIWHGSCGTGPSLVGRG